MELGWEASHKKFCSLAVGEERKVRDRGKTRLAAGRDFLDENITKESLVGKLKDLHSTHSDVEEALRMKELCKKRGSPRKGSSLHTRSAEQEPSRFV